MANTLILLIEIKNVADLIIFSQFMIIIFACFKNVSNGPDILEKIADNCLNHLVDVLFGSNA